MKGTDQFENTIKTYLDNRANNDELFAETYKKEGKTIKGCIKYILSEVQKSGKNGFADEEIYSMAVHYYDEDNLKIEQIKNVRVVVNHSVEAPELSNVANKPTKVKKRAVSSSSESIVVQGSLF